MNDGVDVASAAGATPTINCDTNAVSTVTFNGAIICDLDGFNITHSQNDGAGVYLNGTSGTVTTTISNCNIYDVFNGVGIGLEASVNCTIQDNSIEDCANEGIGMPGSSGVVSNNSSVTIKGNTIGTTSPNQNQESGIYVKGSGSVTVNIGGSGVNDPNTIQYNAESGIRLETISDLTIDNNSVDHNAEAGILLISVGTSGVGNEAIMKNNTITYNSKAGINIGGASYLTVGTNNDISNNSTGGIAFNMGNVVTNPGAPSSQPVTITGNDYIHHNTYAGIGVIDAIGNTVTITQNDIYLNDRAGIRMKDSCNLVITENSVRDNVRGGIKTGDASADPGGFTGTYGSANLTIRQNKIYGNGQSGFGGGMDVRHADGTIYNNLVYENHRGGIRFGDWIDEIINNTVSDNGNDNGTPADPDDDRGGGIIYDDIYAGHAVNAQPVGTRTALPIRNNICTYNHRAGIRAGFYNTDGSEQTAYNLVFDNWGYGNCTAAPVTEFLCKKRQLGSFYLTTDEDVLVWGNPQFVDRGNDDYRLQGTSPAVDAGDTSYGDDVSIPPGVGTLTIDMGAYGGPYGINW
jgi:hypothetical protein